MIKLKDGEKEKKTPATNLRWASLTKNEVSGAAWLRVDVYQTSFQFIKSQKNGLEETMLDFRGVFSNVLTELHYGPSFF
jgi:hypothetical protein